MSASYIVWLSLSQCIQCSLKVPFLVRILSQISQFFIRMPREYFNGNIVRIKGLKFVCSCIEAYQFLNHKVRENPLGWHKKCGLVLSGYGATSYARCYLAYMYKMATPLCTCSTVWFNTKEIVSWNFLVCIWCSPCWYLKT